MNNFKNMFIQNNHIIILALLFLLLVSTGCLNKEVQDISEQNNNNQNQEAPNENNLSPGWNEYFIESNLNDLVIGKYILVMGTENNGSISANQIIIAKEKVDFENMPRLMRPLINTNSGSQNSDSQPIQPLEGSNGQRPDFEEMQNMSNEERQKFMEEMRGRMGERNGGSGFRVARASMERFEGEIIDLDKDIITLKLIGGSKLIFYSNETKILKIIEEI